MIKKAMSYAVNGYKALLIILSLPIVLSELFSGKTGRDYGIGLPAKLSLVIKMVRNNFRITSGSNFMEHLVMATRIMNIPRDMDGPVVECGCYKGVSTANLSLVCSMCERTLEVFDSFAGLPEPVGDDKAHVVPGTLELATYEQGSWHGDLDDVKGVITKYGSIDACNFNVGFFEDTLPEFRVNIVMVFADVDLVDSLKTCLQYLWPLLREGGYFFTHEAHHMEISSLFYDSAFWEVSLGNRPPGLVGANTGLGLIPGKGGYGSALGYAIKDIGSLRMEESPQTGA